MPTNYHWPPQSFSPSGITAAVVVPVGCVWIMNLYHIKVCINMIYTLLLFVIIDI